MVRAAPQFPLIDAPLRERERAARVEGIGAAMPPASKSRKKPAAQRPKARPKARARRSSATWRPRVPVLEQRHYDLIGLGLVAAGVFLAFPLYLQWEAGTAGKAVTDGLAFLVGAIRYVAPVAFVAAGTIMVMRPVLPSVRPFRSGFVCLFAALVLMLAAGTLGLGPGDIRDGFWHREFFEGRGGISGEALFYVTSKGLGTVGSHIVAIFLLLAGILLVTGASVAGFLTATGATVAATTRPMRRTP